MLLLIKIGGRVKLRINKVRKVYGGMKKSV